MAVDQKISELTAGTPLNTDYIPYVDGATGTTKKALKSDLKGDTGATGAKGDTGANGTAGTNGAAGTAATIAVGTVTTGIAGSSAIITNAGTSSVAVFDFTIPRGDTGASGAGSGDVVGPAGATGDNIAVYNSTTGKLIKDGGAKISDLAPKASPIFTGVATIPSQVIGFTTTATSGGTTTLTATSTTYQIFTGTQNHTVQFPNATTLSLGHRFMIDNDSTQTITIKDGGANDIWILAPNTDLYIICAGIGTTAGTWEKDYMSAKAASGKVFTSNNTITLTGTDGTTMTLPTTSSTLLASGGALGTPSSATLTNATGLPVSGITASTATAIGVGSIELGHASDTTITRVSAGVVAIEGVNIDTISGTQTLTNKTLTKPTIQGSIPAITAATDGATITFDLSASNIQTVTLGGNRTLALSNVSTGQVFMLELKQDATGSRTITWFTTISWAGGSAPTLTTTANKTDIVSFRCTGSGTYYGVVIAQNI